MFLLHLTIIFSLISCKSEKDDFQYMNYDFSMEADILSYNGNDVDLVIPEYYKEYKITGIKGIFESLGVDERKYSLETLKCSNVKKINSSVFYGCIMLNKIDFGSVEYIGSNAFKNCFSLKEVHFSECLDVIDEYAFDNCYNLTNVYFYNNPSYIAKTAFEETVVIHGIPGGSVEKYAKDNGYEFIAIEAAKKVE